MIARRILTTVAKGFGLVAGIGAALFIKGVLYRFSIPASSKLERLGLWAFALGVSFAVERKITAVFVQEAEGVADQLEELTANPWNEI